MTKKSDAPAIRFKGFSDAWEQRKVGDLLIERNQQAPMSDEYPLMAFIANEGVAPKGERYDRSALVTDTVNKLYKKTEKGDFIYSSNNLETGSIGLNKYGKACISPVYSIFEPTGIADSDFLGRRLVRKDFINAMVKWRQGVIYGQWRIHESDFLKIEITVPSVEEQRKIGAYLDQLDNLITLHQRKFEKLTNVKKSMLEKMFPQNGSSYPEIRFKGFTDPWEQRKAKEICSIGTGKSNTQDQVDDGKYPFYIRSDVPVRSNKYLYDCEAVITIGDGNIGKVFHYVNGKFDLHQRCYKMTDFKDIWGKYFFYYFSTKFYDRAMKMTAKATVDSVRLEMISEMDIKKPPQISEQKQIAEFFANLDNLITLHQRELEKLQNIKKSMLEKMFV